MDTPSGSNIAMGAGVRLAESAAGMCIPFMGSGCPACAELRTGKRQRHESAPHRKLARLTKDIHPRYVGWRTCAGHADRSVGATGAPNAVDTGLLVFARPAEGEARVRRCARDGCRHTPMPVRLPVVRHSTGIR